MIDERVGWLRRDALHLRMYNCSRCELSDDLFDNRRVERCRRLTGADRQHNKRRRVSFQMSRFLKRLERRIVATKATVVKQFIANLYWRKECLSSLNKACVRECQSVEKRK